MLNGLRKEVSLVDEISDWLRELLGVIMIIGFRFKIKFWSSWSNEIRYLVLKCSFRSR